jgi:hypothetical protein
MSGVSVIYAKRAGKANLTVLQYLGHTGSSSMMAEEQGDGWGEYGCHYADV